jgi:hypothetical protein
MGPAVASIPPHMPVVCSQELELGEVDDLSSSELKLAKDANGLHHYIPISWIARVDDKVHIDRPGRDVMRAWRTEASGT